MVMAAANLREMSVWMMPRLSCSCGVSDEGAMSVGRMSPSARMGGLRVFAWEDRSGFGGKSHRRSPDVQALSSPCHLCGFVWNAAA